MWHNMVPPESWRLMQILEKMEVFLCFCCKTLLTSCSCLASLLSFFNVFTRCFKLRSVSTRPCLSRSFPVFSGPPLGDASPFFLVVLGMSESWFLFLTDMTREEASKWRSSCDITPAWRTKAVSSLCWISSFTNRWQCRAKITCIQQSSQQLLDLPVDAVNKAHVKNKHINVTVWWRRQTLISSDGSDPAASRTKI